MNCPDELGRIDGVLVGYPKVFAGGVLTGYRGSELGMSAGAEAVMGELRVAARLAMGLERLRLIFTNKRIVIAHEGKRGVGTDSGAAFLGFLGSGLEDLFKGGKESLRRRSGSSSPGEILASDRDNFSIRYDEIVSVDLREMEYSNGIVILTGQDKFEFTTGAKLDSAVSLFLGVVGDKLAVKRLAK